MSSCRAEAEFRASYPVPDWNKRKVFLVDPTIWKEYQKPYSDLRPVYRELIEALELLGAEYHVLSREDHPVDIWIRNWGFIEGACFRFEPSYAKNFYSSASVERAREILSKHTHHTPRPISLVFDGGNLIHNGKVAILTEKVLWDNPHIPRIEVERMITSLGFERLVFIPVEPDDVIGHADGILRFLSPNLLLVNDYTNPHFDDYRRKLFTRLQSANLDAEIVPFPWFTTGKKRNGIWSAEGTYINFILTKHGAVLPIFSHSNDSFALDCLKKHLSLPVETANSTSLAVRGGALNCISLTF